MCITSKHKQNAKNNNRLIIFVNVFSHPNCEMFGHRTTISKVFFAPDLLVIRQLNTDTNKLLSCFRRHSIAIVDFESQNSRETQEQLILI